MLIFHNLDKLKRLKLLFHLEISGNFSATSTKRLISIKAFACHGANELCGGTFLTFAKGGKWCEGVVSIVDA